VAGPLGATPGILLGAAVGGAAAVALEPVFEPARQEAWANNPNRILDPNLLARLVAEGAIELGAAQTEATRDGLAADKFNALVYLAQTVPGFAETLYLWRRGQLTDDLWTHALEKSGLEAQYLPALNDLKVDRLDPAVVALAIVRGIMDDPGFLPVGPPSTEGKVKAFPTSPLDSLAEAAAHGIDRDRLFVQTAIAGRPMGPEAAASAVFRQILDPVDYQRAIAEGDVRNEWASAIFEQSRQIPSVADFVRATIKGWITDEELQAGAARHGMSVADVEMLYLAAGRPAAPGQMATAIARGVDGPDGTPMDEAQYLKGIRESDIRPEWGPMLYGIRFAYPALFQLNNLVKGNAIDADTAAEWATNERYAPEVVTALHAYWKSEQATTTTNPRVKLAETQVIAAAKRSFVTGGKTEAELAPVLEKYIPDSTALAALFAAWDDEKTVTVKALTPSQVKRAYKSNLTTLDDAVAELEERGYTDADAHTYLTS
jgi:hypothetical protein